MTAAGTSGWSPSATSTASASAAIALEPDLERARQAALRGRG